MSDEETLLEPPDAQITALREPVFANIVTAHRAEEKYNAQLSKAGWWIGGIGSTIGVLGVVTALVIAISHQPQVRYTEIDDATGAIHESYGAKDAPDHFNERVIHRYLGDYISHYERYVWQMEPVTDHTVKLMSSPAQQLRYAEEKAKLKPEARYGMTGTARVLKWGKFTRRGVGRDKTLEYDVQFIKGEVLASNLGKTVETHMTARMTFQFHPELPMNDQDRIDNEAGLMVITYSASED